MYCMYVCMYHDVMYRGGIVRMYVYRFKCMCVRIYVCKYVSIYMVNI